MNRNDIFHEHLDNLGNTYFGMACAHCKDLDIIIYIDNHHPHDKNYVDNDGYSYLGLACRYSNLDIIQYLIDPLINIDYRDNYGYSYLGLACIWNNIGVIRYLIEEKKMDSNHVNDSGFSCLEIACQSNNNLNVIKYLIERYQIDNNHLSNNMERCVRMACQDNESIDVVKYLMEMINISVIYLTQNKWLKLVTMKWYDYDSLNVLVIKGIEKYGITNEIQEVLKFNPLLLNEKILKEINIKTQSSIQSMDDVCG